MIEYIGKVVLLFTVSVFVIRFIGKGALAQLTSHDLTAIVFLATMAVNPLLSENLVQVGIAIGVVMVLHIVFSKLALFHWLNQLLIGEPTILIRRGKMIKKHLRSSRYSLVNLLATLRANGYPNPDDIDYAILEPTGEISIVPKKEAAPVTPRHLHLKPEQQGLPIAVIVEGKVQSKNLELIGKDERWLTERLKEAGHPEMKNIFYAAVKDDDHSLTVDTGTGK